MASGWRLKTATISKTGLGVRREAMRGSIRLGENVADGHGPAGYGRLGLGDVSLAINDRLFGISGLVNGDGFHLRIDIPNDQGAGGEIIGTLGGHILFGSIAVIVFAADFHG